MELVDVLYLALGDATTRARADFPDTFALVDKLKHTPGWKPATNLKVKGYSGPVRECPWCGNPFPGTDKWCRPSCGTAHRKFNRRRKTRGLPPT